jgi:hypothetical protein
MARLAPPEEVFRVLLENRRRLVHPHEACERGAPTPRRVRHLICLPCISGHDPSVVQIIML